MFGAAAYSWGAGTNGQLGTGKFVDASRPQYIEALRGRRIRDMACGGSHGVAAVGAENDDGEVLTWGWGQGGALGHGNSMNQGLPKRVSALRGISICQVAAGWNHTAFVAEAGDLFTCGDGSYGQLGLSDYSQRKYPARVDGLSNVHVIAVACGLRHTIVLAEREAGGDDGTASTRGSMVQKRRETVVYAFGSSKRGQLGIGRSAMGDEIRRVSTGSVRFGSMDRSSTWGKDENEQRRRSEETLTTSMDGQGRIWRRGMPAKGRSPLDIKSAARARGRVADPEQVGTFGGKRIHMIAAGGDHSAAVTANGELHLWGKGFNDSEDLPSPVRFGKGVRWHQVALGWNHGVALSEQGHVWTWGRNTYGQLGVPPINKGEESGSGDRQAASDDLWSVVIKSPPPNSLPKPGSGISSPEKRRESASYGVRESSSQRNTASPSIALSLSPQSDRRSLTTNPAATPKPDPPSTSPGTAPAKERPSTSPSPSVSTGLGVHSGGEAPAQLGSRTGLASRESTMQRRRSVSAIGARIILDHRENQVVERLSRPTGNRRRSRTLSPPPASFQMPSRSQQYSAKTLSPSSTVQGRGGADKYRAQSLSAVSPDTGWPSTSAKFSPYAWRPFRFITSLDGNVGSRSAREGMRGAKWSLSIAETPRSVSLEQQDMSSIDSRLLSPNARQGGRRFTMPLTTSLSPFRMPLTPPSVPINTLAKLESSDSVSGGDARGQFNLSTITSTSESSPPAPSGVKQVNPGLVRGRSPMRSAADGQPAEIIPSQSAVNTVDLTRLVFRDINPAEQALQSTDGHPQSPNQPRKPTRRASTGNWWEWTEMLSPNILQTDTTSEMVRVRGPLDTRKVIEIGAGSEHTVAIAERGLVFTWGWGEHGQLGCGDQENRTAPSESGSDPTWRGRLRKWFHRSILANAARHAFLISRTRLMRTQLSSNRTAPFEVLRFLHLLNATLSCHGDAVRQ
ncbi:hypothetical protein CBR_g39192 [Chara braunii]|uniref:RCC1-like domain-containing protein n=1 Tax=Chara braunii TaxID=69332 RepID=A0A388LR59_CHABU|nr:hypothetical protein CBR_g39192 [Chara braunii]|eukprot:GBG84816.1 hypothetical protein CBR_g39192 [Chara braunii]